MILKILTPKKSLNKAYLKIKPVKADFLLFKKEFIHLINETKNNEKESEEFIKNIFSKFLNEVFYKEKFYINTKDRKDLVILNSNTSNSSVGVIIETKSISNKSEMITKENINKKAFHELVLYYMRERFIKNNLEVKHLIATNINEWFIFDSVLFDKLFAQNKDFLNKFNDFTSGRLVDATTEFFYNKIAYEFINTIETEIEFTYFNIQDYNKALENNDTEEDKLLIELYKIFSPEHLLKLPFINDSNSLDRSFYTELLHIIGLTETINGGKKLIERNKPEKRNSGTLLEETIIQIESLNKLNNLDNINQYGDNKEAQLFNIALELSITWVNRILFLKLLEGQLISYNKSNKEFSFLNLEKIKNYDDLNALFFQVLACKFEDRNNDVKEKFKNVPYLNSSLFEPTEIENNTIIISNLNKNKEIPIFSSTVLKDSNGKKLTGNINSLEYLFKFLNAYDFSSEGTEDIQEENKTLINASVLGLIFEKINGYKDGSFFTPGFITMYMCHEVIRKTVVQKFNEVKKWKCENIVDLHNKIGQDVKALKEANNIINSLKICDPAVGSGHFLVSALNEIIFIKYELNILQDNDGKLIKNYNFEVVNDELIITDNSGELFEYNPELKESQRLQETLFYEKQTIIENCLFGVDINPNSVKICRLRLWIELLKNAFYKNKNELETLPNIDINIKNGNSLISRFTLDSDLKEALKKSKWTIDSYKVAVSTYQNAENKEQKREIENLIDNIKSNFRSEIFSNDPKVKKLKKLSGELFNRLNHGQLFEMTKEEKNKFENETNLIGEELKKVEKEIEEIKSNKVYEGAFEWRFEFPEVLNEDGEFVGFDMIIGNPPYIRQEAFSNIKNYLKSRYKIYNSISDILTYFVELSYDLLKPNGNFIFIISNKFTRTNYGKEMRVFLKEKTSLTHFIDFSGIPVFDEATVDATIIGFEKKVPKENENFTYAKMEKSSIDIKNFNKQIINLQKNFNQNDLTDNAWAFENTRVLEIKQKVEAKGVPLKKWDININRGILTGLNEAFIIDGKKREEFLKHNPRSKNILKPLLRGRDIKKWCADFQDLWLIMIPKGYTIKVLKDIKIKDDEDSWILAEPMPRYGYIKHDEAWEIFRSHHPVIAEYLLPFKNKAEQRQDKGDYWWELRACAYLNDFNKPKIIWSEMKKNSTFLIDSNNFYLLNTSYFLISNNNEYIISILNSKLINFYFNFISSSLGTEALRWIKQYIKQIPIKKITKNEEEPFKKIVNKILDLKKQDPNADVSKLEKQIDKLVYELYNLSEEEVRIVEGGE